MSPDIIPREMRIAGKTVNVESETTLVPAKSLDALANTIRHEHDLVINAGRKMLEHAVLCGEALLEAKARLKRGEFTPWIEHNFPFSHVTANLYMRTAYFSDELREAGIDQLTAAREFMRDHNLSPTIRPATEIDQITTTARELRAGGLTIAEIGRTLDIPARSVKHYLDGRRNAGHWRGKNRDRGQRRKGRRGSTSKIAITDDLIEGAAIKIRELFGPGQGNVTDSDRDAAVEVLRAALNYDGPIPGEDRP